MPLPMLNAQNSGACILLCVSPAALQELKDDGQLIASEDAKDLEAQSMAKALLLKEPLPKPSPACRVDLL